MGRVSGVLAATGWLIHRTKIHVDETVNISAWTLAARGGAYMNILFILFYPPDPIPGPCLR